MPFLEMSCIYIKRKDFHKILVIYFFTEIILENEGSVWQRYKRALFH